MNPLVTRTATITLVSAGCILGVASATGADFSARGGVADNGPAPTAGAAATTGTTLVAPSGSSYEAVVDGDGTLARGRGVVSALLVANGRYNVVFRKDISACAFLATIGLSGPYGVSAPGGVSTARLSNEPRGVFVATVDSSGADAGRGFHLAVIC